MRRVVISGIGALTPVGNSVELMWQSFCDARHGIGQIEKIPIEGHKASLAAEVRGFDPNLYIDKRESRRMDLFCQYAMAATKMAFEDAGLEKGSFDPWRAGVIVSSGIGGLTTLEIEHTKLIEKGPSRISPFFVPMMIPNMAAGLISIEYGCKGVSYSPVSACASSAHAIGEAFRNIKNGYADIIISGGAEAAVTDMAIGGFSNMTALSQSTDPDAASLPFDRRRAGFVMGEGAAILILEEYERAIARGAKIYAEVKGYGATTDAYHITGPDPSGTAAAKAMSLAIEEAGLSLSDVDYINAHGTGTPLNDKTEAKAIGLVFGDYTYKLVVSSTKSMTGHMLGAAGGIEAIAVAKAIETGIIPPTANLKEPDPECSIFNLPTVALKHSINAALSNSFGFGGHNASLLMAKCQTK